MAKHQTNEQMIVNLMNFSKAGALIQPFILQAIDEYAKQVLAADLEAEMGEHSVVSPAAWRACAEDAKAALDKHFAR